MGDMSNSPEAQMLTDQLVALAEEARVSASALVIFLARTHYRWTWVVNGGHVQFADLMAVAEWTNRVASEFKKGRNLRLIHREGPYVLHDSGSWMLVSDKEIFDNGTPLQKAVFEACNNAMENDYPETLTDPPEEVAVDVMTKDAFVEKLEPDLADVRAAVELWQKGHTPTKAKDIPIF